VQLEERRVVGSGDGGKQWVRAEVRRVWANNQVSAAKGKSGLGAGISTASAKPMENKRGRRGESLSLG